MQNTDRTTYVTVIPQLGYLSCFAYDTRTLLRVLFYFDCNCHNGCILFASKWFATTPPSVPGDWACASNAANKGANVRPPGELLITCWNRHHEY